MLTNQNKDLPRCYLGIDISQHRLDICLMDSRGMVVKTFSVCYDQNGFNQLLQTLPHGFNPVFSMESTGPFSGNLLHYLQERGYDCVVSNSFEVARLRDAFSKSVKTDTIDAFVLAQAARLNVLKHSYKERSYIYLQDILERYHDLKDRRTGLINQLRANLVETFPEFSRVFKDMDSISALVILGEYPSTKSFAEGDLRDIQEKIGKHRGRVTWEKLAHLSQLCQTSVAWKTTMFHESILQSQVRELTVLKAELTRMEDLLDDFTAQTFPRQMQLLQSIPGIGKISAMQALAVLGDPRRFDIDNDGKGAKRVSSFAGFGIREYSSGSRSVKGGISKRGNPRLRGFLFMAAFSAIRVDKQIADYYESKKQRTNAKQANLAVAHLLIRRIYGVLKTNREYNGAIPAAG